MTSSVATGTGSIRPGETPVFYYIDQDEHVYQCNLKIPTEQITLSDLKQTINQCDAYEYYIKSSSPGTSGPVTKLVSKDDTRLEPCNGRIVLWLKKHPFLSGIRDIKEKGFLDTDSNRSVNGHGSRPPPPARRASQPMTPLRNARDFSQANNYVYSGGKAGVNYDPHHIEQTNRGFETDSVISSLYDDHHGSYSDSEFDRSSRASTIEPNDMTNHPAGDRVRRRKFTKQRPYLVRASSASSVTDTVYSAATGTSHVITVRFNREHGGALGIRLLSDRGNIYVDSILKGCVVDMDQRIQIGDTLLQVNGRNLTGMTTDAATCLLRDITQNSDSICLKILKSREFPRETLQRLGASPFHSIPYPDDDRYSGRWTNSIDDVLPSPSQHQPLFLEPSRPINLDSWIANTEAMRPVASLAPTSLFSHSLAQTNYDRTQVPVSRMTYSDRLTMARKMAASDSGLEVKNRMWLKIEIKNAFMGKSLIRWLRDNLKGLTSSKEAKRYASQMMADGLILPTMGTGSEFSEKAYYTFDMGLLEEQPSHYQMSDHMVNHEDLDDLPDSVSQVAENHRRYLPPAYDGYQDPYRTNSSHSSTASGNSSERRLRPAGSASYGKFKSSSNPGNVSARSAGSSQLYQSLDTSRNSYKLAMGKY